MADLLNEERAGGVVFRKVGREFEYLLVTSNSNKNRWIFPAGHVETGESHEQTALREVAEEAGVLAETVQKLGNYQYVWYHGKRKLLIDTHLFLMRYVRTVCENPEGRQVAFFHYEEILNLNLWEESREFITKAHHLMIDLK